MKNKFINSSVIRFKKKIKTDNFRVAKEYAPGMVSEIQREYIEAGGSATSLQKSTPAAPS